MTTAELGSQLAMLGLKSDVPEIPSADILAKPLDVFRSHLASLIASAVNCDACSAYDAIADSSMGDLELIVPKLKLRDHGSPLSSVDVSRKLPPSPFFTAPFADGPRITFYFSPNGAPKSPSSIHPRPQVSICPGRKKVLVEFSSPNVGSEFNGNHLRSTLIGSFISNIYELMGWDIGGKEIALLAIGFGRFGSEDILKTKPLEHMLEVYLQIKALFKPEQEESRRAKDQGSSTADIEGKGLFAERDTFFRDLESRSEAALHLWSQFRELGVSHLRASYLRMGIEFDEFSGESQVNPETMNEVEAALKAKGVLDQSDEGSWVIDFTKHSGKAGKGLGVQVLRNHDGTTTYLLRDIGAAIDRYSTYHFDKMIYVVSSRQSSHFQQLSIALKLMDRADIAEKIQHASFGELQGLPEHMKGPLLLDNILDECNCSLGVPPTSNPTHEPNKKGTVVHGDAMAVGALVSREIAVKKRSHNYALQVDHMAQEEGAALNLQQFYAKIISAISELQTEAVEAAAINFSVFEDDAMAELFGILARYPEVTTAAFKSLEPHTILVYLSQLAYSLDLDADNEDTQNDEEGADAGDNELSNSPEEDDPGVLRARLELYRCVQQVVENGMRLLGFPIVN
ncbi:Arginine-tRNA ligase [Fusarium oxysporum f. sp. vasinfectum]|nr:Arginine-tRNA ligase [Fusarium oxysporum f. sp. vasinfectum]